MNKWFLSIALVIFGGPAVSSAAPPADGPKPLSGTFLMEISESGKTISDTFELWALAGVVAPMKPGTRPPIALTAVVFTQLIKARTDVMVEPHDTLSVEEVQRGLFRLRFSGNGKGCSDLEAIVRYSAGYAQLLELTGSARGGLQCEHVYTYHVSRDRTRTIPALTNGVYLAFPSFSPSR
jgi:hypothetical protein